MAKKTNKVSRLEVTTSHSMEGFLNQRVEDDTWLKCWVCYCSYIPSWRKVCLMLSFSYFRSGRSFCVNMTCTSSPYLYELRHGLCVLCNLISYFDLTSRTVRNSSHSSSVLIFLVPW